MKKKILIVLYLKQPIGVQRGEEKERERERERKKEREGEGWRKPEGGREREDGSLLNVQYPAESISLPPAD